MMIFFILGYANIIKKGLNKLTLEHTIEKSDDMDSVTATISRLLERVLYLHAIISINSIIPIVVSNIHIIITATISL